MKVLVTDPIDEGAKSILDDAGIEIADIPFEKASEVLEVLPEVDGWILRSGSKVTKNHLEVAKNLKVIGRAGVGVDNIDVQAATHRGVVVMNTPGINTVSAAEHTIALILSLARNVHEGYRSMREGKWDRHRLMGTELRDKTLGVVGLGKVGTEVIRRLHNFGMKILGYDPYISKDHYELDYVEIVELDELCTKSDIITLHVPLTDATHGMFDLPRMKMMKSSALLVNCARGGVVVEEDLRKALNDGIVGGAAVDVFENEPAKESPLFSASNVLFTPHLGASTHEAKQGISRAICEQVRDFLIDGKIENALNIPVADLTLLNTLKPYLELTETLAKIHQQLLPARAERIVLETQGTLKDVKLVTLAFLKEFLQKIHGSSVNFVNAAAVAEAHGIQVQERYSYGETDYSNAISTTVVAGDYSLAVRGSLFGEKHPRVIYFDGFHLDLRPTGNLLLIYNQDVPGVVGKVGTFLGSKGVNIAGYQLSRKADSHLAFGIIRLDDPIDEEDMKQLSQIDEIIEVKGLTL